MQPTLFFGGGFPRFNNADKRQNIFFDGFPRHNRLADQNPEPKPESLFNSRNLKKAATVGSLLLGSYLLFKNRDNDQAGSLLGMAAIAAAPSILPERHGETVARLFCLPRYLRS